MPRVFQDAALLQTATLFTQGGTVTDTPRYSQRFIDALVFAAKEHERQPRKMAVVEEEAGRECIPYVSHLLGVAAIVFEAGGDENAAIAGLLHDAVEDQDVSLEEIAEKFGSEVAHIVDACSEHWDREQTKPEWKIRKNAHLARLQQQAERSVLLVTAADKIHNGEAIINDLAAHGPVVWKRFNAHPDRLLWYYTEVTKVVRIVLGERSYAAVRLNTVTRGLAQAVSDYTISEAGADSTALAAVPTARA